MSDHTRPTGPDREPTHLPAGESPWGLPPESDRPAWDGYPTGPHTPSGPPTPSRTPTAPYGPPPSPRPPRGGPNPALVVALVAGAIVLVVGLVTGGVVIARGGDDDTAGGRGGDPTSAPPSSESSEPSSPEPTSMLPLEPSAPASPSESPEEPAVPASGAFKYQEYGGDWDFRYGDVSLFATFRKGWNYRSCRPVEKTADALAELGCRRASSWTYRALDGHLALTHVVLTMRTARAAQQAASGGIEADDWRVDPDGWLDGVDGGTWEADAQGSYVVLTVETHDGPVRKAKADEFRAYANSDITAALIFRD